MNIAFTASRADYGKLKPVILEAKKKLNFKIFVTGSHLLKEYGNTKNQITKDFKKIDSFRIKNLVIVIKSFSKYVNKFTKILNNKHYDCFFIHGDRIETLAAGTVLTFSNIRIAHIEEVNFRVLLMK